MSEVNEGGNEVVYASTGESVGWVCVTPEMAVEWLLLNTQNRSPRSGRIDALRRDLSEGRWKQDGSPLRWGENGLLMDGQHRLMAQIEEGYTIEYLVVWDLKQEAMDVIDSGAKRLIGDSLNLRGIPNANQVGSVAKCLMSIDALDEERLPRSINQAVSKSEIIEYIEQNPQIIDATRTLMQFKRQLEPLIPSAYITAYLGMAAVDEEDALCFFDMLAHPEIGITATPGVYRLYLTKASQHVALQADTKPRAMIQIGLIWRAWNDYRRGVNASSTTAYRIKVSDKLLALPKRLY